VWGPNWQRKVNSEFEADPIMFEVTHELRRFSLASILQVALKLLNHPFDNPGREIEALPWVTLLIAEFALGDSVVATGTKNAISRREFKLLRAKLWEAGVPSDHGIRMVRSIAYTQCQFQLAETFEFVRWPAIIDRLHLQHALRRDFVDKLGLTPDALLDVIFAVYSQFLKGDSEISAGTVETLRAAFGSKLDALLSHLARDVNELRETLSSDERRRRHSSQLVVDYPVFQRFPLLWTDVGSLRCWHPKVLTRGIDEFIHTQLSPAGHDYASPYGEVFEDYVVELALSTGLPHLGEKMYKRTVGREKKAVEIILRDDDCNVFIEAKFGLYQDAHVTFDDARYAKRKLSKLRDGVGQAADVSRRLATREEFSQFKDRKSDFLLVVTNRQLHIPTGRDLESMSSRRHGEVDPDVRLKTTEWLLIENIFVVSLHEFERLFTSVAEGRIRLVELLSRISAKMKDPMYWRLSFEELVADNLPPEMTRPVVAPLIKSAVEAALARTATALGQPKAASSLESLAASMPIGS